MAAINTTLANTDIYPFSKFRFRITIDGGPQARVSEITGTDSTTDVIEYRVGDYEYNSAMKMPGLTKYGNITLKWGMTTNKELYDWVRSTIGTTEQGDADGVKRKNITIELLNRADGTTVKASWQLLNAWPCKYTGPDFNATSSEIAFESLELAHEGVQRLT